MRDKFDDRTLDFIPIPRGRGRPKTGTALTPAEKQARYRQKKKANTVTVTINRDDITLLKKLVACPNPTLDLDKEAVDRLSAAIFLTILEQEIDA